MIKFDFNEIALHLSQQGPDSVVYLGCDSQRIRLHDQWYADYTLVIVVHRDGKHGCKLFGEVQREIDYDQRADRPRLRLMTEAYKISELYLQLADVLEGRRVEVHLDINPNDDAGSHCVINEAVGYIRGTCNVIPMVKPRAFAASYAADRYRSVVNL